YSRISGIVKSNPWNSGPLANAIGTAEPTRKSSGLEKGIPAPLPTLVPWRRSMSSSHSVLPLGEGSIVLVFVWLCPCLLLCPRRQLKGSRLRQRKRQRQRKIG